jgi:hypothetical protein
MNNWLKAYLLPCPFKYLTGIDCPGCGFQRSILALMQGDIQKSFNLYPPTVPLLLMAAWWLLDSLLKLDTQKHIVKKAFFISVSAIVIISYSVKLA